jgi:hypothetical protein
MRTTTKIRCMLGMPLVGLRAACNTNPPSPLTSGYVSEQWSAQMSPFAIVPVFPPRADLQAGDLYLSCDDSTPGAASGASTFSISSSGNLDHHVLWFASLNDIVTSTSGRTSTPGLLDTQFMKRVHMHIIPIPTAPSQTAADPASATEADTASATRSEKPTKVAAKTKPVSTPAATGATAASDIFQATPPKMLMAVSLPEFLAVAATSTHAQTLIPFPSILAKAGMSYSKAQYIEITAPEARACARCRQMRPKARLAIAR